MQTHGKLHKTFAADTLFFHEFKNPLTVLIRKRIFRKLCFIVNRVKKRRRLQIGVFLLFALRFKEFRTFNAKIKRLTVLFDEFTVCLLFLFEIFGICGIRKLFLIISSYLPKGFGIAAPSFRLSYIANKSAKKVKTAALSITR